jgi:hypothetical protein
MGFEIPPDWRRVLSVVNGLMTGGVVFGRTRAEVLNASTPDLIVEDVLYACLREILEASRRDSHRRLVTRGRHSRFPTSTLRGAGSRGSLCVFQEA